MAHRRTRVLIALLLMTTGVVSACSSSSLSYSYSGTVGDTHHAPEDEPTFDPER
jgi:hypothetical protein